MLSKSILLVGLALCGGCTTRPAPPTPTKSPFLTALDLRKSVEATAPNELGWSEVVQGGVGTASPGRGQWSNNRVFMLHGDLKSAKAILRELHDDLVSKAKRSGADVQDGKPSPGEFAEQGFEFEYSIGNHKGNAVARIEQPPENAHILDGREATHQLTIEITESFQAER